MRADTPQTLVEPSYDAFTPGPYLEEFYREVSAENRFILDHLHRTFATLPGDLEIVDLGGGPTIYQDLSAARVARRIVFSEYVPANRRLIRDWLAGTPDAFDWTPFAQVVAELEGRVLSAQDVLQRLRCRISDVVHCDLTNDRPLGDLVHDGFDVAISAFCIESITASEDELQRILGRVASLLRPDGHFVGVVVRDCEACRVGDRYYRTFPITEKRLVEGLSRSGLDVVGCDVMATDHEHGYTGIIAFHGVRR